MRRRRLLLQVQLLSLRHSPYWIRRHLDCWNVAAGLVRHRCSPIQHCAGKEELNERILGRPAISLSYSWEATSSRSMGTKTSPSQVSGNSSNGLMSTYSQTQHLANEDLELTFQEWGLRSTSALSLLRSISPATKEAMGCVWAPKPTEQRTFTFSPKCSISREQPFIHLQPTLSKTSSTVRLS